MNTTISRQDYPTENTVLPRLDEMIDRSSGEIEKLEEINIRVQNVIHQTEMVLNPPLPVQRRCWCVELICRIWESVREFFRSLFNN